MSMPLQLAPMATLSHRALRELIESFGGCDEYFTEMISARGLLSGGHLEQYYIDPGPRPEKLVYQLMGPDAESIASAAAFLDSRDCLGIDINMGCSAPHITRLGGGVSWMAENAAAVEMVQRVREEVKKHRLSVKIRLGFDEDPDRLLELGRKLESAGVEMIILHPRTAKQKFKRSARWSFVELLNNELSIPVTGNGDVSDARTLVSRAGGPWSGVMVGRAAVQQPWIFIQAENALASDSPSSVLEIDREETGQRFLDLLKQYQPHEFWKSRAHRFFEYYSANFTWGHAMRTAIQNETDIHAIGTIFREYFRKHPDERIQKYTVNP
ncbi:tRNA dihydrouridine synthase [Spirochaeta dissipatitropha]